MNNLKALFVVAAILFMAACSHQEMDLEDLQQGEVRIVPFTATVKSGIQTRATVVDNEGYQEYRIQANDHLYVWTEDGKVYGDLSRVSGSDPNCSFSGNLTVESGGTLKSGSTILWAAIKSENDQILGSLDEFRARGFTPAYTTAIATSIEDAVQKFSYFKASGWYVTDYTGFSFSGGQYSSFLSFDITLEDGTATASDINVTINNGGSAVRTGSVTTLEEGGAIHAKFVAGFPTGTSGTTLSSATVKLGNREEISFGGTTELAANQFYNVAKTYTTYKITASGTINNVPFSIPKENIKKQTTLGEILGTKFNSITSLSSSGTSISFSPLASEWQNTTVTINSTGVTTITVSGTEGISGYNLPVNDLEVGLNVAKMSD